MKIGIPLGLLSPRVFLDVTVLADSLGYESVWLPEHLVFPVEMAGSPHPGDEHPPVPPHTKVFDAFAMLSFLAAKTSRIRLGTNVYLLGLRHPFVAARAIQTFDIVSEGRAEIGIGAGWLREEWVAAGLDPATRGRRLDEALAVCKRLWTEEVIEHRGEFFSFGPVMFEPKPVQKPWPPLHVGGESEAALRRAARASDGWFGLQHDAKSAATIVKRLTDLRRQAGRESHPFAITIGAEVREREDLERFRDAGVDRVMVRPWQGSRDAPDALRRFADRVL